MAQVDAETKDIERIVQQQEKLLADARAYAARRAALAVECQRVQQQHANARGQLGPWKTSSAHGG